MKITTFGAFIIATSLVAIIYALASMAVKHRWNHVAPINPLKIIADFTGRASLSNMQVFFFTLIVTWLAIYWVVQAGALIPINSSLLALLGIAVVGSGASKAVDTSRLRVTAENWAWAKKKGWIKNDFTRAATGREPKLSDLLTSDQGFEIAKFQAVAFSLVVGISLLYYGTTTSDPQAFSTYTIPGTYLSLIGISQGVYVGGKLVGANLFAELNTKLDKVRTLELAFTATVVKSSRWAGAAAADKVIEIAREKDAPTEYTAYISAATEAAEIVGNLTGIVVDAALIQPELPPIK